MDEQWLPVATGAMRERRPDWFEVMLITLLIGALGLMTVLTVMQLLN